MKVGDRVFVHDGTDTKDLGKGTYLGEVDVYAWFEGKALRSMTDAEETPHPENVPAGCTVRKIKGNPKIKLDSGKIVYGCQVWWGPAEEKEKGGGGH